MHMKSAAALQGQQLVEYLLLFAIVVIVFLVFVGPTGPLRKTLNQVLDTTINQINIEANKI